MTASAELNTFMEELYRIGGGRTAPRRFRQFLLAARADQAEMVLRNPETFHKNYGALSLLFKSRLNTDGIEWQSRRTLTQEQYYSAAKPQNRNRIIDNFEKSLDTLSTKGSFASNMLPAAIEHALMNATALIFFGSLSAEHNISDLISGVQNLRRIFHALEVVSFGLQPCNNINDLINQREIVHKDLRRYASEHPEVEHLLTRFDLAHGTKDFEATGELLGNFLAGAESSVTALTWAMLIVGEFPKIQERMRAEANTDDGRPLIDIFLNETLRLFPPFPIVTRVATQDFDSPGFAARKGENVLLSIIGVHLDPEFWVSPIRFDPERREFANKTFNRKAFIPFLHGPRVCGGVGLAQAELREGFAALLRRYRFRRTSNPIEFQYVAALRPVLDGALSIERL